MPPTSSERTSIAKIVQGLLIAVITASLTWFLYNYLNRARLRVDIVRVDVASVAPFTRLHLTSVSEFFDDSEELMETLLGSARALEAAGVDFDAGVAGLDVTAGILHSMLEAQRTMNQPIEFPVASVKEAVAKAREAANLLDQAIVQINTVTLSQDSAEDRRAVYKQLFVDLDSNPTLFNYTPVQPDDDAVGAVWYARLLQAKQNFSSASTVIRSGLEGLEEELKEAEEGDRGFGRVRVKALIVNSGNSPTGIFDVGALDISGGEVEKLHLESTQPLEKLIVGKQSHAVVEFELLENDRGSTPDWQTIASRFEASTETCTLRIKSINGRVVESMPFPFYKRDSFRASLLKEL